MKIKDGILLKKVGSEYVVMSTEDQVVDCNHMISLNESGAFIFKALSSDLSLDELLKMFLEEYEVEESIAKQDIMDFISILKENDFLA